MSDNTIHPDSVQLEKEESAMKFTRYWTEERLETAKLLAKKIKYTEFDAVEKDGFRAEHMQEDVYYVEPMMERYEDSEMIGGLPSPDAPWVHIEFGWGENSCKVIRLHDNTNMPEK